MKNKQKFYQIGLNGQEIELQYDFNNKTGKYTKKQRYINPNLHKKLEFKLNKENRIVYKKYRDLKIEILKNELKEVIKKIDRIDKEYKELINRTEFWERKTTLEYDFDNWNIIKKVNGKLIRYYNQICNVIENLKNN